MSLLIKILVVLVFAEVPAQLSDSLDKIEVFILRGEWLEAVGALRNVSDSDKNKRYRDLLEQAAIGYVRSEETNLSNAERIADELPKTFPPLIKNEAFQHERDRVSQIGFAKCFDASNENTECALRLFSRVDKDPERTSYLIWAAMQLFMREFPEQSYKTLALGAKSKGAKRVCQSVPLVDIAVNTLAKDPPHDPTFLKVVKELCWKDVRSKLAKEIATQKSESFLKNACGLFKEMKTKHAKCG